MSRSAEILGTGGRKCCGVGPVMVGTGACRYLVAGVTLVYLTWESHPCITCSRPFQAKLGISKVMVFRFNYSHLPRSDRIQESPRLKYWGCRPGHRSSSTLVRVLHETPSVRQPWPWWRLSPRVSRSHYERPSVPTSACFPRHRQALGNIFKNLESQPNAGSDHGVWKRLH
jgi:hypothetical protein